jgi:hypothetical protein
MYSSDEFDFVDLIAAETITEQKAKPFNQPTATAALKTPKKGTCLEEAELSPLEDFYSLANAASDDEDAQYFLGMFKAEEQATEEIPSLPTHYTGNKSAKSGKRWFHSKRCQ